MSRGPVPDTQRERWDSSLVDTSTSEIVSTYTSATAAAPVIFVAESRHERLTRRLLWASVALNIIIVLNGWAIIAIGVT